MFSQEKELQVIIDAELEASMNRFPIFNSDHEGYSVIREEYEEAEEALNALQLRLGDLWYEIKNNKPITYAELKYLSKCSVELCKEAIQVSAMIEKFKLSRRCKEVLAP